MLWKEVHNVRKTREQLGTSKKGAKGEITGSGEVRRSIEYFEGQLNVIDDRVIDVRCLGWGKSWRVVW